MAAFRAWVKSRWLAAHPSDADELIAARAVEAGVPSGVVPRRLWSPLRGAYLYVWEWPEPAKEGINGG